MSQGKQNKIRLKAYCIHIRRAYSIWEQGDGYSLTPWSGNTEYYEGYDDPVAVELQEGVGLARTCGGHLIEVQPPDGPPCSLDGAVALGYAKVLKGVDPEGLPTAEEYLAVHEKEEAGHV